MKIGILLTGKLPPAMVSRHGEYDAFFRRLLGAVDPGLEFFTVDVVDGEPLGDPARADGWLVTGSRHGVYEDHPWIEPLKAFLRAAIEGRVPVVGVCFGHQILAEALGGRAVKSDRGWGLGVHSYKPAVTPSWMPEGLAYDWNAIAIHQDQVVEIPEHATVLAASDFCPYAALAYGDPEAPYAISVQPHPEYTADALREVMDLRMKDKLPPEILSRATESLDTGVSGDAEWAKAIVSYFRAAGARRPASAGSV
ncbi:C26 family cysteine hydrolase domain-containing family [Halovulum dunhuangense]|uniref:C26 family cysteine hydrolase domain-containing family n=1 Tax=Halovulum dunhuangense TaxID=1505036 RepID=A0A849KZT8_9RHOB|nr:gamma-glutamyl-gamma-aminobutyrate hydrolase family protein [Halovulum dunhuangense]NNU79634.1 C26 family cysteine hydrolase domain-containing family [Halovulum dunhuangense]